MKLTLVTLSSPDGFTFSWPFRVKSKALDALAELTEIISAACPFVKLEVAISEAEFGPKEAIGGEESEGARLEM